MSSLLETMCIQVVLSLRSESTAKASPSHGCAIQKTQKILLSPNKIKSFAVILKQEINVTNVKQSLAFKANFIAHFMSANSWYCIRKCKISGLL